MLDCIKKIAMDITEELMDAQKYIDDASKVKEDYPSLAELYKELSAEELSHAERLHEMGNKMVSDDDDVSKAIWDWETERMARWEQSIRVLHEMFQK